MSTLLKGPTLIAGRRPLRQFPLIGVSGSRGPLYATGSAVATFSSIAQPFLSFETMAWLERCPPNFSKTHYRYVLAMSRFISGCKRIGCWDKLDEIWWPVAPLQSVRDLGIKGFYDLTPVNSPSWSPYGGYLFDGATNYLETGINLATFGGKYLRDDACLYAWVLNDAPGLYYICGATSEGARVSLRSRNGVSALIHANATTGDPMRVSQSPGMIGFSRLDANTYRAFKSGATAIFTRESSPLPNGPFRIGRFGTGSVYSLDQVGFECLGGRLSEDEEQGLYSLALAFLIEIGVISDDDPYIPDPYGYGAFNQSEMADVTPVGLEIVQQSPPPADDTFTGSNYTRFLATLYSSQSIEQIVASTRTDAKAEHLIWGPRHRVVNNTNQGFPNPRPNQIHPPIRLLGQECRLFYSTRGKAEAAWIVAQRYSAGALARGDARYPGSKGWLDVAEDAGFDVSGWDVASGTDLTTNIDIDTSGGESRNVVLHHAHLAANAGRYFPVTGYGLYRTSEDIIYLPSARACDSPVVPVVGFTRDTEDGTNLTPAELLSTVQDAKASCAATGHKLSLWMNPQNSRGAIASGMDASVGHAIMSIVDHISITAWGNNIERDVIASLNNQWQIFRGPDGNLNPDPLKFELVVALSATGQEFSDADAYRIRNWYMDRGIMRISIWPNYAVPGGERSRQVNRVCSILWGLDPDAPGPTP